MDLTRRILKDFAQATNNKPTSSETTMYGTISKNDNDIYVKIDGSDVLTPVTTMSEVVDGERVMVMVKNHSATVIGNASSPSARIETVQQVDNKIVEFDKVMADEITTNQLNAINATIENLKATVGEFGSLSADELTAINAQIDSLKATYAELDKVSAKDMNVINAEIENLKATIGSFGSITTDELKAATAEIDKLVSHNAEFKYVSAESLKAHYANIDFSNIGKAAMEYFYAKSGLIENVTVGDQTITGRLIGVTISGDLIEGNTIKAEKLVVKGEDGIYYKLNVSAGATTSEQISKEDLQNGLSGSVIIANSITAEKISVDDLVAFDATIAGFNITDGSLYSGVKEGVKNTTRGAYLDSKGQFNFGDDSSYLMGYIDEESGEYRIVLKAHDIILKGVNVSIETAIEESVNDALDKAKENGEFDGKDGESAVLLHIESSRGLVFKNNAVSTILSVVLYYGSQRITDSETMKSVFGNSAYLQWSWQRLDEDSYGLISASDSRFMDNGFKFILSPDDVDAKIDFLCELIV